FPYSVAVLPFAMQDPPPEGPRPDVILREVFYNYFSYLGYADMSLEEVDARLKPSASPGDPGAEPLPPARLKELLGVDAVVEGQILDANNFTGGIYAETRIHAKLKMVDLRSGETLWETEHREMETSSLAGPTIVNIVQQQLENAKAQEAYYQVAEQFSIKVLKKVPDPAGFRQAEIQPPKIERIETSLQPDQKLAVGDMIEIRLYGQPGLSAAYDIGNWKTSVPLVEIRPGAYFGAYTVSKEDRIANALIIGSLKNQRGLIAKKVYREATVTIEGTRKFTQAVHDALSDIQ
ncbi:MAG: GNA1162 family protein, partial [Nitrospinales bacterium]